MKVAVIGEDRRFELLAQLLAQKYDAAYGTEAAEGVDWIVSKGEGAVVPGTRRITLGGSGKCGIELLHREDFARRNAALTAEGAVYAAMGAGEGAIAERVCLVVGFGRIAQALAGILRAIGAQVVVAARRPEVRAQAQQLGFAVCGTEPAELAVQAARADFLFSTPPAPVITQQVLSVVRPGVPVIDLASPPFGVDLAAARQMGVNAWRESGVPGRYCPAAAAVLMAEFVERIMGE